MKKVKLYSAFVVLILPFLVSGQDMQQLLHLSHNDSIVEQIQQKDSLGYTAQDHFQLGMFETANGNYKKALKYFEKTEKLGGEGVNDLVLSYFMGRSEAGLRNFQKSKDHFEKLLKNGISPIIIMMTPETYAEVYREFKPLVIAYGLNFGYWDYIFLLVSVLGFAFSLFLIFFFSKRNRSIIYIGIFTAVFSINILEYVLYWTGYVVYNPLRGLYLVLFFLYPPLLYLYIKNNIDVGTNRPIFPRKNHLHFLPFYCTFFLLVFYRAFPDRNLEPLFQTIAQILFSPWLKLFFVVFYMVLTLMVIKGKLHSLNIYLKRWITLLTAFYIFMATSYFLPGIFSGYSFFNKEMEYFFSILYAVFVFMCGVMAVIQPEVFLGNSLTQSLRDTVKYKNSSLTERMAKELKEKLGRLLENEKIYMQSELNLIKLADQLNIDRYSMSQVINEGFGKGFYELMNEYRVQEAKRILQDTDKNIGDVIFEVGFNNHASFYKAFKKHTKITPSKFVAKFRN